MALKVIKDSSQAISPPLILTDGRSVAAPTCAVVVLVQPFKEVTSTV